MRIGLIVPGFSADEGDWCIPALRDLVRELACRHEIQLFALRYPHRRATYQVEGTTVHALGGALARRVARVQLLARARACIANEHRRRSLDLLHGFWADEPGLLAVTAARGLRVPAVVSLMGGELAGLRDLGYGGQLGRLHRMLIRQVLRRATCVTVGSASLRRLAEAQISGNPVLQLPLGVDTRRFHPYTGAAEPSPLVRGEIKLLHVASLVPVKDQDMLLRALALTAERVPQVHLHVVGEGPLRGELEQLAASLGVAARVTFHGPVRHEQLPAYYRAADLCVLSSRHESQGMVVLEAAACGRATVGTAVGVLPELAPATRAVPVGDARALADTLVEVLRQPARLAAMGQACLQAVTCGYTLERRIAELSALYCRLSGSGR